MTVWKKLKNGVFWTALMSSPMLYPAYPEVGQQLARAIFPNISEIEAKHIIEEEKRKLGISSNIELKIYHNDELDKVHVTGYSCKKNENEYTIGINKSNLDRVLIRHELFHIYRDKDLMSFAICGKTRNEDLIYLINQKIKRDKKPSYIYTYLAEPRADLYSWSGIKL